MLHKIKLLDVAITTDATVSILEHVFQMLKESKKKFFIVTPNPEILVYAQSHLDYKDKLNSAEVALADGVGILLASRLLGLGVRERTTGVDFIEKLCETSREKPVSMGFLGGRRGVAERTAECLKKKYPWITVGFVGEELGFDPDAGPVSHSAFSSELKKVDILFVAYGFPKQEEWIVQNLDRLPIKAAMGVGGAFDFISGDVKRAPKVLRSLGLEWLFRLIVQPWRLKRQLSLPIFLLLVLKAKFSK